jgi:xylan 1,4-beta-xylosidase
VLEAAGEKKVVLVIMSGGAVCLGMYKDDDRVNAIYFVGYPGQSGGEAIAEVIYGDYNPSGKLSQTFYQVYIS